MPESVNPQDIPSLKPIPNRPTPLGVPNSFIQSALDGARSFTIDPIKESVALSVNYAAKLRRGAESLGLGFEPKEVTPALDRISKSINDWTVQSDTYHQLVDSHDTTLGRYTGDVLGFGGFIASSFATGGLVDSGEAGIISGSVSKVAQKAGEEASEASTVAENADSVQSDIVAQTKAARVGGFIGRMAKFNVNSMPFILGSSTRVDNDGNIALDSPSLVKNLLIANTLPFAVEAMPAARVVMTKIGTLRTVAAYRKSSSIEVPGGEDENINGENDILKSPSDEEVKPKVSETKSVTDDLSQEEKDYLADLAEHGQSKLKDAYVVDTHVGVLPENRSDLVTMMGNPHRIGTILGKAIRAVISKGLVINGKLANVKDSVTQFAVSKFVKQMRNFHKLKGLRQVYLNDRVQKHLTTSDNKELLNDLDKRLFDAKPYNSTGAKEVVSSGQFIKSEESGIRTFNYPDWFRVRKHEVDSEALDKLNLLASKGDKVAQYMRALSSENSLSQHMSVTEPFLKNLKRAVENPVNEDEIDDAIKAYYKGSNDEASAELESNINMIQKELENADFKDFTESESPRYVKLLKSLDSDKLRAYITCILG